MKSSPTVGAKLLLQPEGDQFTRPTGQSTKVWAGLITGSIEEVSRRIQVSTKRPLLVAIDGGGGAGKSTLAQELGRRHTEACLIEVDDFYAPKNEDEFWAMSPQDGYERYFDWERLREQVLEPLARGGDVRYQLYDWSTKSLKEWRSISPKVAVVEGCFTLRPELRGYFDLKVWVEAPAQIRRQRMLDRDHGNEHFIPAWMAAEEWYFKHVRPVQYADLIIGTA